MTLAISQYLCKKDSSIEDGSIHQSNEAVYQGAKKIQMTKLLGT